MHNDDKVYGGSGRARVLVGTRAANSVAFATATPPSPSRLVGLGGVDVVESK
jgi:hypothetical protein